MSETPLKCDGVNLIFTHHTDDGEVIIDAVRLASEQDTMEDEDFIDLLQSEADYLRVTPIRVRLNPVTCVEAEREAV